MNPSNTNHDREVSAFKDLLMGIQDELRLLRLDLEAERKSAPVVIPVPYVQPYMPACPLPHYTPYPKYTGTAGNT